MKKIVMSILVTGLSLNILAQSHGLEGVISSTANNAKGDKVLTMEETILGYALSPASKNYKWRPSTSELTFIESKAIQALKAGSDDKIEIISLEQLNRATELELKVFPTYNWLTKDEISIISKGEYYKIDVKSMTLVYKFKLSTKGENFTVSAGDLFAYTKGNNLYYCDKLGNEFAITNNTDKNIVSGQAVSRSEFGISGGIFWSNDAKKLAYYRKDESKVSTFPLLNINSRKGELIKLKYPMAGMKSELVQLGVYDISSQKSLFLEVDDFGREQYLTNITWSPNGDYIYVQVLDRDQKNMRLNKYSAETGECIKTILTESHTQYVEPLDCLVFLKSDNSKFIYRTDNYDGYRNLYLCDDNGVIKRITEVDADVKYVGQDKNSIYYTSAEVSPIENHFFKQDIKSGKRAQLTSVDAWHGISLSPDASYFVDKFSNIDTPQVIELVATSGKSSPKALFTATNPVKEYNYGEIYLGSIKSADGKHDNYYRLTTPMNFDPTKKYPTIVYVYGGPHSQLVKNSWLASQGRWEMYMAQRGYVVYVQDNRGTTNRGVDFEKSIHGQCGQAEMADQMEGIKMLQSLAFVDADRIGVHGWSYGGFMTISLMTNYPEVFKVGVSGGPVIDWKWYEAMYGERYMDSPHRNAKGYEKVSLISRAKDLEGRLLICQGAVDDVVLWQHSLSFIRSCIMEGKQVDYFPYPTAKHNVLGKDRIHLMDKVSLYFEDFLK